MTIFLKVCLCVSLHLYMFLLGIEMAGEEGSVTRN
jgi:hypothetical protein